MMDSLTLTILIAFAALVVLAVTVAVRPDAGPRIGRRRRGSP